MNNKSSGSTKVLMEMKEWLAFTNENVIFRMIVGKSFLEATDSKYSQGCYLGRKTFLEFLRLSGTFVISDSIPFLRWLDLGGHERAMKKIAKELEVVFKGWLEEHKHKRKISGRLMGDELDFMDVMLSILGNNEVTTSYDADTINIATSLVIFHLHVILVEIEHASYIIIIFSRSSKIYSIDSLRILFSFSSHERT